MYWLPLLAVGLTAVLQPCSLIAQGQQTGLILSIVAQSIYNVVKAGEEATVYLEMANLGPELKNIQLSTDAPKDWTVDFRPAVIDSMAPGNVQTVEIVVKPARNTAKGEYDIAVVANADGVRRVTSFYIQVQATSLIWVWIGAGVAAVLIIGFIIIFMRFGRDTTEEE